VGGRRKTERQNQKQTWDTAGIENRKSLSTRGKTEEKKIE